MRRMLAVATVVLTLSACQSSSDRSDPGATALPVGAGPLAAGAILWAVGDTIHIDDRRIRVGRPVRAMVEANGRIYLLRGRSDAVLVTDGDGAPRPTGFRADSLSVSADGRYLGLLDQSQGSPWSTVIADLDSGEVVVRDGAGMGDADDDLADLYEDAEPQVLGFKGHDLYIKAATGSTVMSLDAETGERTEHGDQYFFARPDPGGGRVLPGVVRQGQLVVPKDPYMSTQHGHVSPDGSLAVMPVGNDSQVFEVDGGHRLPADLQGRRFVLGGWTSRDTAYGIAFDGSPFGPHPVRLVTCRFTVQQTRCRVLRAVEAPPHDLVLFPTGSSATDY